MSHYSFLVSVLRKQPWVKISLKASARANLPNWCIAGGLIRDAIWGEIYGRPFLARDIDLLYFDDSVLSPENDWELEAHLQEETGLPFSVRNQARMNDFNKEEKYTGVIDAMSKFPTTVSAIGLKGDSAGEPVIFSIYGYHDLLYPSFRITPHFAKAGRYGDFFSYLNRNGLRQRWPEVPVHSIYGDIRPDQSGIRT